MANVAVFRSNQTPQYLTSVNTPDYSGDPDVIINPDISGIINVPQKYWKRDGILVKEMTLAEKNTVEVAELLVRKSMANEFNLSDMKIILTALIKVINIRLSAGLKITQNEMVTALKEEIV